MRVFDSVVDSLRSFRSLVIPRCDVITNVTQHFDDQYRNTTRFFTSAAKPPSSFSRDHVGDDITASRDPDEPGVTLNDVTPASETTFRLVLLCLDVIVLLYRVTHVCRIVNRMRSCWSRDHRKCYNDESDDDDDYYWSVMMTRDRTRQISSLTSGRSGLDQVDQVDETDYQLPVSSTSTSCCLESSALCRAVRSTYVVKTILFVALVTWCHIALRTIDSSHLSGHIDVVTRASQSGLPRLDADVRAVYRRQRQFATTSFDEFVINSMSHLSVMIQLITNGNSVLPLFAYLLSVVVWTSHAVVDSTNSLYLFSYVTSRTGRTDGRTDGRTEHDTQCETQGAK